MPPTPEQRAREAIDALLTAASWIIQDNADFNRNASEGVAVREFVLPNGPCDYLLFVGGKAAGVVEAKKAGHTLSGVAEQSAKYMAALPGHLARWAEQLVFDYESTGDETYFRDMRDPKPRSRRVFAFHQPHTLHTWLQEADTLRQRLQHMPPLDTTGLRDCQVDAVNGLEASLAKDQPRALIQMATGAGKTFTACTFSWRLLKHARAKRILFLVDRNNLGDQTLKEYQNYDPPGAGRKFDKTYIVQHLHGKHIDPDAKVCITTIQRLYAMLRGEELDEAAEEGSAFETWSGNDDGEIAPLAYNPAIPIEQFDFIVTDECHRSIYGLWRQVLEYFDAHLIGLTATPSAHTLGFFNRNLVAEYPYEQSVVDGVNVGFEVYRISTQVGEHGGTVDAKFHVPVRDRRTRAVRYKQLDADLPYSKQELDHSVTVPNQIRLVLGTFRDKLFTELFPGRSGQWVPKTLIFAKDDHHAEEIVKACWEVFGQGNEFAKKITYQTSEKPKELIAAFRVDPFPRIAVTVDMIATGTDIKPVECLIFMRDVKSQGYYEQMKGRGVRTLNDADLRQVTPDAQTKTRFVLIDAVGVTEGQKCISKPMERKRSVPFDKLIDQIAQGRRDGDAISSLAARLAALDRQVAPEDRQRITDMAKGLTLRALAGRLLHAISPDIVEAELIARHGNAEAATPKQVKAVETALRDQACGPLDDAELRKLIKAVKKKNDIVIDELSTDELTAASYDLQQSQQRTTSFREFIETNKNQLLGLPILYSQPFPKRRLTYASIRELALKLGDPPHHLTAADVWQAYKRLQASLVRGAPSDKVLTDIISLVRFATGQSDLLEPYAARAVDLPTGWVWASPVQLESTIPNALTIGPFGSNLKVSDYTSEGVPLIFVRNIRSRSFNEARNKFVSSEKASELSSHVARAGDVLITKMGDPPGEACVYPVGSPSAVITADCIKWTLHEQLPAAEYFSAFINSHIGRSQFAGITKGVAQQKVSVDRFRKVAVALPGAEEQREIADRIELEMQRIKVIEAAIRTEAKRSQAGRQSILKAAFSGLLVAQRSDDEPALELLSRHADLDAAGQELTRVRAGRAKTRPLAQVMKEHGMQPPAKRRTRPPRGV